MGAPAIFEKQIEIKLLHFASTEEVTDSGMLFRSVCEHPGFNGTTRMHSVVVTGV
ncbi:MAG: hypothetical protein P8X74_01660 [Reinekea sp.]